MTVGRRYRSKIILQCIENDFSRQQFWQQGGRRLGVGSIQHIDRDALASVTGEGLCDGFILIGPVRLHQLDAPIPECLEDFRPTKNCPLIDLAGQTPLCGEVNKDRGSLGSVGCELFRGVGFPSRGIRGGGGGRLDGREIAHPGGQARRAQEQSHQDCREAGGPGAV